LPPIFSIMYTANSFISLGTYARVPASLRKNF